MFSGTGRGDCHISITSGFTVGQCLGGETFQVVLGVKNPPANAGDVRDVGSIPGSGRSPGEGNGNPLQYSCLENAMDGGAWWATVHGVTKSRTRLSDFTFTNFQSPFTHKSDFSYLLNHHNYYSPETF